VLSIQIYTRPDIHTTLQSRQDVLNFADRLEESGFADLAKEIKANPDKWVGATLSFVLTSGGGIGAFSLRKEGEVISGSREETYDINRDIKLDERRDEVIDVTGTKKEVYTENITRQETGDITRYYGGNIFVGNAIEAAIGQKSVDPLLNRPHILNLLRDEASKEDLQLVASEVTTVIEEHGSLTQVIEKAQRGELGGKFGTILSKYIKMGIEAGGQSYITSGVEAQRNLVRQAVYNALEELIGNQDYSARDRWGFLISWSGNFIDSFNERNYGDMNPEAVHFTNPTFVKEQASFGGAPEYYVKALGLSGLVSPYYLAAMYSKDGTVMTGELVRWATEAMSMGLQGKEALEYLRRHAFDPNPSEEDIEAIRNKTIYKVETGSESMSSGFGLLLRTLTILSLISFRLVSYLTMASMMSSLSASLRSLSLSSHSFSFLRTRTALHLLLLQVLLYRDRAAPHPQPLVQMVFPCSSPQLSGKRIWRKTLEYQAP